MPFEIVIKAMEGVPDAGYPIAHSVVKTLSYADDPVCPRHIPYHHPTDANKGSESGKVGRFDLQPKEMCISIHL